MSNSLMVRANIDHSAIPKGKALQATGLLLIAGIFGGGGSGAGICNLIVQLAALSVIAFNHQALVNFFKEAPRFLVVLVSASLLLPILQSIPLPPSIWHNFPGRNLVSDSLTILGRSEIFFSISLNVQRTVIAFLSLIPPLAILILAWKLSETEKRQLLKLIVALGIFVVILGTQQLATGNQRFVFFAETYGSRDLQGTFANRNSAGLFLNIALCALIGAYSNSRPTLAGLLSGFAMATLLIAGIIMTRSRSSIVLASIPLAFLSYRIWKLRKPGHITWPAIAATFVGILILAGGTAIIAGQNQRIQTSLARFTNFQDERPLIWNDTLGAISRFWPIGSGLGTFDEVFQIDETLENLRPGRAARAHNDYLEAALESGLPGILLIGGWMLFLLRGSINAIRQGGIAIMPIAVFALLALQSILDYPLRNQTLLCVAGLALALLILPPPQGTSGGPYKGVRTRRRTS